MRIGWRMTAGLLIIAAAVLGTILGTSFTGTSSGSGANQYEVTVRFNTTATQQDIEEAGALLHTFDDDLEFLIMESFPPIGRAVLTTDASDFCQTVEVELGAESYVGGVFCRSWMTDDAADTDSPVSADRDTDS